jgi:type I restriction enzyme S subunit
LPADQQNRFELPLPPLNEQNKIVSFLNKKCGEIDELMDLETQMIDELKAYKQTIITEAVTRGLNPNVPMRNSGIEWIGEIPIEYKFLRIKNVIAKYKAGPFGSSLITGNLLNSGNILVYTPEHIAKGTTNIDGNLYLPQERLQDMVQFCVNSGDVIFPIVGSLGRAMVVTPEMPAGIINQRLAKFQVNKALLRLDYFMYVFSKSSFYTPYIAQYNRGSFIVNLTKTLVEDMPLVLPPLNEQQEIVKYLDSKCADIDALIALRQEKIDTLKEYKKSLIFEYVTGKKQVV